MFNGSKQNPERKANGQMKNKTPRGQQNRSQRSHTASTNSGIKTAPPKVTGGLPKGLWIVLSCFLGVALSFAAFHGFLNPNQTKKLSDVGKKNNSAQLQHVSRRKLQFTVDGKELDAYYTGALQGSKPLGEGIYEFDDTHGPWSFAGTVENGVFTDGIMTDYPYTINFTDTNSYSRYTGPFHDSMPSGNGIYIIYTDGNTAVLEGHYDQEKGFSGKVSKLTMTFEYNEVSFPGLYSGEYIDGQPNGQGHFASESDLFFRYDGKWDNGTVIGPGRLHTNNARISINGSTTRAEYNGQIDNGGFNGAGSMTVKREGGIAYQYSGNWLNNMYSGKGKLSVSGPDNTGYSYDGYWKDGVYDGEGSLIYDSDNIIKYIGHFENGNFRPTFTQLITCLCSAENSKVALADHTLRYIDQHQTDFVNHFATKIGSLSDFSYWEYVKSQSEENSRCFTVKLKIIQSKEYDTDVLGYPVTEFIGTDDENKVYYGYYIGYFNTIKSGDTATVTAYPISYSSYISQDGSEVPSLRFLAYSVE